MITAGPREPFHSAVIAATATRKMENSSLPPFPRVRKKLLPTSCRHAPSFFDTA